MSQSNIEIFLKSLNRKEWLREALQTIYAQTLKPAKITILDNGSKIDVQESLKADIEAGKITWVGPEGKNTQFWNFKRALTLQQSPYALIMHDDDRLLPNFCERQSKFLDENPTVVAVGPRAIRIDEFGKQHEIFNSTSFEMTETVFLKNSAEAAAFYCNSFVPWPGYVYRKGAPQITLIKEKHGKCTDVVFMVDLAASGSIAYNFEVLWEHRVHSGQASETFSLEDRVNLLEYLQSKAWEGGLSEKLYSFWHVSKKRLKWVLKPEYKRV